MVRDSFAYSCKNFSVNMATCEILGFRSFFGEGLKSAETNKKVMGHCKCFVRKKFGVFRIAL